MISFVNGIVKLPDFPKCVLLTGKRTEGKLLVFAQEPEHITGKITKESRKMVYWEFDRHPGNL